MVAKVYHMNGRSHSLQTGLVAEMLTLFDEVGFGAMIEPYDIVAIKLHCGEWNNTAYLRPVYARALADKIKELGGRPFVCDTVTLTYSPYCGRITGLDLLITAERNGFTSAALGCPFIVADGFNGTDDVRVDLPEGFILKEAYIAKAIALADVVIALTHFKGHPMGVIGGSLKNLGIGAQSRRGKYNVHMGGHPEYGLGAASEFHPERCKGRAGCPDWELCERTCPYSLLHVTEHSIEWRREECVNCLSHLGMHGGCGVTHMPKVNFQAVEAAIADGCLAVVKAVGQEKVGFINMAIDISPACDCVSYADMPLVPNLGVLASKDPVALDKATLDLATASAGMPGSAAEDMEVMERGAKKFETAAARMVLGLNEETQLNAGQLNGLGSKEYELVEVEPREDAAPFRFPEDPRPAGLRLRNIYAKEDPFPRDRYEGQGFKRLERVDLSKVV